MAALVGGVVLVNLSDAVDVGETVKGDGSSRDDGGMPSWLKVFRGGVMGEGLVEGKALDCSMYSAGS